MIRSSDAETDAQEDGAPAYVLTPPAQDVAGGLVFASPHSGRILPADMDAAPAVSTEALRSAEDVGVDRLTASGPGLGIPLICGMVSRAYVDLNRAPGELDPLLIEDCEGAASSAKVAAGFGVIPRRAGDGTPLYDRRLPRAEAERRLERVHAPYHAALAELMRAARARHGMALLVDWHSMPSRAVAPSGKGRAGRGVDIVLGDRHGASCRGGVTRRVRALMEAQGWRVGLNAPYAGGYSTETWGRPEDGFQAIQIEVSRGLYLDEATLEPSADHGRFLTALERVIAAMAREVWPR